MLNSRFNDQSAKLKARIEVPYRKQCLDEDRSLNGLAEFERLCYNAEH